MHLFCPQCGSKSFKRNGYTRHGKQNHRCFDCGRQFSLDTFSSSVEEGAGELSDPALTLQLALERSF